MYRLLHDIFHIGLGISHGELEWWRVGQGRIPRSI